MDKRALVVVVVAILLCWVFTAVDGDTHTCRNGEIYPESPYFLENEPITLICRKNANIAGELSFERNDTIIDQQYSVKLNGSATMLKLPPLSKRELDQSGTQIHFLCNSGKTCVRSTFVDVEYALRKVEVEDIMCRMYNWMRMECWWSLGVNYKNSDNIKVTVEYIYGAFYSEIPDPTDPDVRWNFTCRLVGKTRCVWEGEQFSLRKNFYLRIKVQNIRRAITEVSSIRDFVMNEINEPAPVKKLSVIQTNASCVNVEWKPYSKARTLRYKVAYHSDCDPFKIKVVRRRHIFLCDIEPNSYYNISITAQYFRSRIPTGHWSTPNTTIFKTAQQVPSKSPDVITGLYDHVGGKDRNLTIYWQPLDLCDLNSDAESFSYVVTTDAEIKKIHDWESYSEPVSVHKLPANITIQAENNQGNSRNTTIVQVKPGTAPKPSELIVEFIIGVRKGPVSLTIVPAEFGDVDITNISHTLVTCKGLDFCTEPVQWRDLPEEQLNAIEIVTETETRFGLITRGYRDNQPVYTGIVWQKCVYQEGLSAAKPVLKPIEPETQPVEGFRLEWLPQDCSDKTGYIKHYEVFYCRTKKAGSHTCQEEPIRKVVDKRNTSFTQTGLPAGAHFAVWLQSVGLDRTELETRSEMLTVTVMGVLDKKVLIAVIFFASTVFVGIVIGIVCLIKVCKDNLESQKHVDCTILDDLIPTPDLQQRNMAGQQHMTSPDEADLYSNPSTDSGNSSLPSNAFVEGTRETDPLLIGYEADSAINLHHSQESVGNRSARQEEIYDYQRPSELSCGTMVSDDEKEEEDEESDETDTAVLTETDISVQTETEVCTDDELSGVSRESLTETKGEIDIAEECENETGESSGNQDDADQEVARGEGSDVCNCELHDVEARSELTNSDSIHKNVPVHTSIDMSELDPGSDPEHIEIHSGVCDVTDSDNMVGYGYGTTITIGDSISSNSDALVGYDKGVDVDPLDGYSSTRDMVDTGSISNLSDLSECSSEDFDDRESKEDRNNDVCNDTDIFTCESHKSNKFKNDQESHDRPVEGDVKFVKGVSKLSKKNMLKITDAGHSSGDYHMATVDSTGNASCDIVL